MEKVYEGMFLLDSSRYGRDPEAVAGQIPRMIEEIGGKILVSRLWEERRLAYAVKGHRKGTYWLTYFQLEGPRLGELRRKSSLSDSILRSLFVRIDPRLVNAMVEHAMAGPAAMVAPPEEAPKPRRTIEEPAVDAIADE